MHKKVPKDAETIPAGSVGNSDPKKHKAYMRMMNGIFVLLGIGALLPFNCVITPFDYWQKFYPPTFLFYFAFANTFSNWCIMVLMIFVGERIPRQIKMYLPLALWLFTLILLPLIYFFTSNKNTRMVIAMICIAIIGMSGGFFFPTGISVSSQIEPTMPQAFMAGNGIAGVIALILQILSKGITQAVVTSKGQQPTDNDLIISTIAYFVLGAIVIVACIFGWYHVTKVRPDITISATKRPASKTIKNGQDGSGSGVAADVMLKEDETSKSLDVAMSSALNDGEASAPVAQHVAVAGKTPPVRLFVKLLVPGISVFFVFWVTLALFPAVTNRVPNVPVYLGHDWDKNQWWPIIFLSFFLIFDWVGRSVPQITFFNKYLNLKALIVFSFARLIYVALFLLMILPFAKVKTDTEPAVLPIIANIYFACFVMLTFAFTNGYVSTMTMMKYSASVPSEKDLPLAGTIMTFWLNSGLLFGGCTSLVLSATVFKS